MTVLIVICRLWRPGKSSPADATNQLHSNPELDHDYGMSLALDAAGMAHISIYDLVTRDLYYTHLLDCGRVACRYGYLSWIGRGVSANKE